MPQAVTIRSLPRAFAMIKAMQDQGYEWGEDYRQSCREALVETIEEQMDDAIDRQLAAADIGGEVDRARDPTTGTCGPSWAISNCPCRVREGSARWAWCELTPGGHRTSTA